MKKITLDHCDSQSADLVAQHIEQLSQLFPEVIKEGKVDFEALQDLLGNYIDTPEERFQLNWAGKSQARREAQKRSTGTLRPCPEESVEWDTTENLYIEGDNLEVLKLLQKSYYKKVKMIYIDPPYNTGKDFVYKDNYIDNMTNYLKISRQDSSLGTNTESDGRYHSNWLNMMYPRLKLARNMLADDGVILVNMDEHEISNLHKIMCEIFGEDNDLGTIIWDKRNPKGDAKGISYQHEYISVFTRSIDDFLKKNEVVRPKKNAETILKKAAVLMKKVNHNYTLDDANKDFAQWMQLQLEFSGGERAYNRIDDNGDVYRPVSMAWPNKQKAPDDYFIPLIHPETKKKCPVPERGWRNPTTTMLELLSQNQILFGKDEMTIPNRKYLLKENMSENITSLLYYGGSDISLLKDLGVPFDTPKVVDIVKEHVGAFLKQDEIILDFFSGSATTAHAVMQLNSEDGGNRKYIMIQLPEVTPEDSEAKKAGYKTITEIGKERIRRVGKKIVEEVKAKQAKEGALFAEEPKKLDIGFKVFKLDSSNINTWDSSPSNLEGALYNSVQNIKSDRTEHDLLYEILLKYGIDLVQPINEHVLAGKKVYEMGAGALIVCMADHVKPEVAEAIAQLWKDVKPTAVDESSKAAINCRVVFKDNGFEDNNDKTNVLQILKQHGIDNVVTI